MAVSASPVAVATLLCHSHIDLAERCLAPTLRKMSDPHELFVFDDGSLDDDDVARLRAAFGEFQLLGRGQCDQIMRYRLAGDDDAQELRGYGGLFYKLYDVPHVLAATHGRETSDQPFAFIDSDVLATRPFLAFESVVNGSAGRVVFGRDRMDSYALCPRDRMRERWMPATSYMRLPRRLNSGFFALATGVYRPDLVRRIIRRLRLNFETRYFYEQTTYAVLAAQSDVDLRFFNFADVNTVFGIPENGPLPTVLHFVTPRRHLLDDAIFEPRLAKPSGAREAKPVDLFASSHPSGAESAVGLAARVAWGKIHRCFR